MSGEAIQDVVVDEVEVQFPEVDPGRLDQDQEWCLVRRGGTTERVRFHDYARIFQIPGLYEELFYTRLECTSPATVQRLLIDALRRAGQDPADLAVLDLGAGNGMVGEALKKAGVSKFVGADVVPEAREACHRDRPGLYDDYVVADFTDLPQARQERIAAHNLNALTTVAALGFDDIPSRAFTTAWNLIDTPGWVAFNIKEAFLDEKYQFGFSLLIRSLIAEGLLDVDAQHRYLHRKAISGEPLYYMAIVGRKTAQIPEAWIADLGE
jgi:hypothetical protein